MTINKPMALGSQIKLEFRNVGFREGRKTSRVPREKTLVARMRTNNKLNPYMARGRMESNPGGTLVGGKHSHNCSIAFPLSLFDLAQASYHLVMCQLTFYWQVRMGNIHYVCLFYATVFLICSLLVNTVMQTVQAIVKNQNWKMR